MNEAELETLAARFVAVFPHMAPSAAAVAVRLYRLLARGSAVAWPVLAEATGMEEPALRALLGGWAGVYEDVQGLTGFGGLSVRAVSRHRLRVGRRTLFARCAWDTLILPELLGEQAEVESDCAISAVPIRLTVHWNGILRRRPQTVWMSLLSPQAEMAADPTRHF